MNRKVELYFPTAINTAPKSQNFSGLGAFNSSISATELMKMQFPDRLKFTGEWHRFLGNPSPTFSMLISCLPGHGKTLFCLKFANYLAENFGRVIFFENEMDESLIKSDIDFLRLKPSQNLDFNFTANTPQAIAQVLESGRYKFCFIDSLQMSKFKDNNEELWALKQRYPIGFCCISFANGAGKVRGSMEKQHQDDITITFAKAGVAVTLKNRFGKVGEEFTVFE